MKLTTTRIFNTILVFFLAITLSQPTTAQYNYWQQGVDYTMEIDVDTEKHQFTGSQTLVYTNNSPDELTQVFYHLYFNAFQPGSMMDVRSRNIVDPDRRVQDRIFNLPEDEIGYHNILSLSQDGEPLEFVVEGTILIAELAQPLAPGASTTFEMEFESQVPRQIRRSGWANAEGVEFSMSQWYPKMAAYDYRGWHPNPYIGREFHGNFGRFEVKITIDSDYVLGGTGVLQNPDEIGHGYQADGKEVNHDSDRITYHFVAEDVLDFFWGADPDFVHTKAQVPNGPELHFFYQQPVVDVEASDEENEQYTQNWEELREYTVRAFEYANENFGEYPYPQFSTIQGGDGGMEYPMGTLITGGRSLGSLVGVTVHEMYHSWYQNVLATNESLYPWMDEGFTSWASSETMAHLFDREGNPHGNSYNSYRFMVNSGNEEPLTTHADHYSTNRSYVINSYSKGAVYLNQLSYILGDQVFRPAFKKYHQEWKLKHPTDLDFIRLMEKESGMILDWYHEYFVTSTKFIDYAIDTVSTTETGVSVQLKKLGEMPMPLDVYVEYSDGSLELFYIPMVLMRGEKPAENDAPRTVLEDWPWVQPDYQFMIDRPMDEIKAIIIDPSQRLADINLMNNVFEVGSSME